MFHYYTMKSGIVRLEVCAYVNRCISVQSHVQSEVEQLRLELQNSVAMYNQACEDLVHAQNKVRD